MSGQPKPSSSSRNKTLRRRMRMDKAARWIVWAGGFAVVASILGIFVFIFAEVLPLMQSAKVSKAEPQEVGASSGAPIVLSDPYKSFIVRLTKNGDLVSEPLEENVGGAVTVSYPSPTDTSDSPPSLTFNLRDAVGSEAFIAAGSDGSVQLFPFLWTETFDPDTGRKLKLTAKSPARRWGSFSESENVAPDQRNPEVTVAATPGPNTTPISTPAQPLCIAGGWEPQDAIATLAGRFDDGTLRIAQQEVETNDFTGEETTTWSEAVLPNAPELNILLLNIRGDRLYGIQANGQVYVWEFRGDELSLESTFESGAAVSSATLLLGDRSLLLGRADGVIDLWFRVRDENNNQNFQKIRSFDPFDQAVIDLAPNSRNKGFLALAENGSVAALHSTSHRQLWKGDTALENAHYITYTPKGDGAWVTGPNAIQALDIKNPHPEAGLQAYFGKVWYEDYETPQHTWQSSSGSDDFEPKFGLMPLIFGTFKGTFFSLLLAAPLGIFGAMFASQFMHTKLLRVVKPAIELMAAIPSVILGFLAALWLAPRMEMYLPGMVAIFVVLPCLILVAHFLYELIPARLRNQWKPGTEVWFYMIAAVVAIFGSLQLSGWFESMFFGGNVRQWIEGAFGVTYEQRNAVVVGIAMGFAVVPIIFTVAEDAFSNVPKTLVSGSLALGATPWQTVTQIVLPTASPGIFSAVMIGLGRAIGETMIVLMATGNTPIMDWNPFNGFRTLSANIAVEIPEAPVGGTLYRTLFLAALLLFIMTFMINTLAEVVRHRLRKKYAEL